MPVVDPTLSVSGAAADAAVTGGRIAQRIKTLNDTLLQSDAIDIYGLGVAGFTSLGNCSVSVGSDYIQTQASSSYISRELIAQRNGTIYFGSDVTSLTYVALAHGKAPVGSWTTVDSYEQIKCNSPFRYRLSDNNIPVVGTPLNVEAGDILVLTTPAGAGSLHVYGSALNLKIKESIIPVDEDKINTIKRTSAAGYDIKINGFMTHMTRTTTGGFTRWNLLGIEKGADTLVTTGTDILGPIRESNNLYIGGVHGQEEVSNFAIYKDGILYPGVSGQTDTYKTLDIVQESDLTSTVTSNVAWHRFYHLHFENNKITVENIYTCSENNSVIKRATNGGIFGSPYSILDALIVTDDIIDPLPDEASTVTSYLYDKTIEATFLYSTGNTIIMKNIVGSELSTYKAIQTVYGSEDPKRIKVYFLPIDESTTYNIGDKISGKFSFEFN